MVKGVLRFLDRDALPSTEEQPRVVDYRSADRQLSPLRSSQVSCAIADARRDSSRASLDTGGFTLLDRSSEVTDWFDTSQVTSRYYGECERAAQDLTGASHTFTFDHLIREPGKQTAGGGLDGSVVVTGADRGGGYVNAVHMDYTTSATWAQYLALHDVDEPQGARQVVVLNFWRPILNPAHTDPLAVCDATTVDASDLVHTEIFGYGHAGYSWHDIGVGVYEVAASDRHDWYYFPSMTVDEALVFKTYDSHGVVGRACPHGSFADPTAPAGAPPRSSIELRVLCYIGADAS